MRIVDELRRRRVATRGELADATGLSRATIATLVVDLEAQGLVVEYLNGEAPARVAHVVGRLVHCGSTPPRELPSAWTLAMNTCG